MKTDEERWAALQTAAATARVRVQQLSSALGTVGVRGELVKHIDVALRRLPSGPNGGGPPIEDVSVITTAIADLERMAGAAGVADPLIAAVARARRALHRAADAFLVDTQVIT